MVHEEVKLVASCVALSPHVAGATGVACSVLARCGVVHTIWFVWSTTSWLRETLTGNYMIFIVQF